MTTPRTCTAQTGPAWKAGGEPCGCHLPAGHLDDPTTAPGLGWHECDCGAWWSDKCRRLGGDA